MWQAFSMLQTKQNRRVWAKIGPKGALFNHLENSNEHRVVVMMHKKLYKASFTFFFRGGSQITTTSSQNVHNVSNISFNVFANNIQFSIHIFSFYCFRFSSSDFCIPFNAHRGSRHGRQKNNVIFPSFRIQAFRENCTQSLLNYRID